MCYMLGSADRTQNPQIGFRVTSYKILKSNLQVLHANSEPKHANSKP